jgi:3-isopropylmalate dehydrogenase
MRVARWAFELARRRGRRRRVTAAHKANVLKRGDGLFLDCCREVARQHPDVAFDDFHVDTLAMHLVQRPQGFDVIVTTNMFGDILSDEAAGLVGGLGMAAGLNVGEDRAMAQAVHGSAPDIADLGCANPVAEILSGAMLLEWLASRHSRPGLAAAAAEVERAVRRVLETGRRLTPDLGGTEGTAGMAAAIAAAVEA